MKCKDCVYYQEKPLIGKNEGLCLFHPPIPYSHITSQGLAAISLHPKVEQDNYCSYFQSVHV